MGDRDSVMKIIRVMQNSISFILSNEIDVKYFLFFVTGAICTLTLSAFTFVFALVWLFIIIAS
jgi:hypothetical protein